MQHCFVTADAQGRIIRWGAVSVRDDIPKQMLRPGEIIYEHSMTAVDTDRQYIRAGILTSRPVFERFSIDKREIVADGVDTLTISGLPNPTKVTVRQNTFAALTVTDGVFELSSDKPGEFTISLDAFPYAVQVYVINAT